MSKKYFHYLLLNKAQFFERWLNFRFLINELTEIPSLSKNFFRSCHHTRIYQTLRSPRLNGRWKFTRKKVFRCMSWNSEHTESRTNELRENPVVFLCRSFCEHTFIYSHLWFPRPEFPELFGSLIRFIINSRSICTKKNHDFLVRSSTTILVFASRFFFIS